MTATTARARIQKGKDLENYVAESLQSKGLDLRAKRSAGSGNGNREKADLDCALMILNQNVGIECKHVDTLKLEESWRQAQKLESLGREPLLVFKWTSDKYQDTKVVMYLETLLELVKQAQGVKVVREVDTTSQGMRNKLQRALYAIKDLVKEIEHDESSTKV